MTQRMTDVHPANSPYNLLGAVDLEDYLRKCRLGYQRINYYQSSIGIGFSFEKPLLIHRLEPREVKKHAKDE